LSPPQRPELTELSNSASFDPWTPGILNIHNLAYESAQFDVRSNLSRRYGAGKRSERPKEIPRGQHHLVLAATKVGLPVQLREVVVE
jgi:hypothetical protein